MAPTHQGCLGNTTSRQCAWARGSVSCPRRLRPTLAVADAPVAAPDSNLIIQTVCSVPQMQQVARLRAEAYYEDDQSRFVESFKKQFVSQEIDSLQKRTAPTATGAPRVECLIALRPEEADTVVGCIDIRLPYTATQQQPPGVPPEDPQGAYLLNVVVHEDHRGQGVGKALMWAAMQRAYNMWNAKSLYTHVEADNEVAYHLYTRCGFDKHSSESRYDGAATLGRLILLQATADKS